jgi:hypothetical protein
MQFFFKAVELPLREGAALYMYLHLTQSKKCRLSNFDSQNFNYLTVYNVLHTIRKDSPIVVCEMAISW